MRKINNYVICDYWTCNNNKKKILIEKIHNLIKFNDNEFMINFSKFIHNLEFSNINIFELIKLLFDWIVEINIKNQLILKINSFNYKSSDRFLISYVILYYKKTSLKNKN